MEFKGTRGKWEIRKGTFGFQKNCTFILSDEQDICLLYKVNSHDEEEYNAQLISKAPQLLEEHNVDIDQIEVWIEWLKDLENDERYTGIIDTMKKCIEVKKQLIKEVTEL